MISINVENQSEVAKKLGISRTYLCDILKGRRGCSQELRRKLYCFYPNLNFKLLNPRYILEKVDD